MPDNTYLSNLLGGGHVAISPGGDKIAFIAVDSAGVSNLWVRSLDALNGQMLSGTEGALFPFWSPDGRTIAFYADDKLKKIDPAGGTPFTICDAPSPRGGSWSESGVLLIAPNSGNGGIFQVSSAGGAPSQVTLTDTARDESTHRWPVFLPDGDHFLFFIRTSAAGSGSLADSLCVGSVSTGKVKRFLHGVSDAAYANGHLLYMRETALMAQQFDPANVTLTGDPVPIVQQIQYDSRFSKAVFTVSRNGLLLYQAGGTRWGREIALFDTSGRVIKSIGQPELYDRATLSSDGKRIAMEIIDLQAHNTDLWVYEIARGVQTRFTFDPHHDFNPIWSPDGGRIVFSSDRKNRFDLYIKNTSGSTPEELLTDFGTHDKYASHWSSDGNYVLFETRDDSTTQSDLWILPMTGDRKPVPFVRTQFNEAGGTFSPDMRWISYVSDESGKFEAYVRPFFPPSGQEAQPDFGKWQVSTGGSVGIVWRKDSKALFYVDDKSGFWIADIRSDGRNFEVLGVTPFMTRGVSRQISLLDISADGMTLLGWVPPSGGESVPFTLVTNWDEELQ
jgi:Tol biopolymer transport system component